MDAPWAWIRPGSPARQHPRGGFPQRLWNTPMTTLQQQLHACEAEVVRAALVAANGNISLCARNLGVSRMTLYRKMAKHGIDAPAPKPHRMVGQRWSVHVHGDDGLIEATITDISHKAVEFDNSGEYLPLEQVEFVELLPSVEG